MTSGETTIVKKKPKKGILSITNPFVSHDEFIKLPMKTSFQEFTDEMREIYGVINYSEIELLEVLGKGGFGQVLKAYRKKEGDFIALKYGIERHR